MPKLETYIGFDPDKISSFFKKLDWSVELLFASETNLVKVTKGAALECGDGRFDQLETRLIKGELVPEDGGEVRGVRILGGVNAIMAILTGGDEVGLQRATDLLFRFGVAPGTHSAEEGGCGYADLWISGKLKSAVYPYELQEVVSRGSNRIGQNLRQKMRDLGGRHFRLNGNHLEEGVRLNPFRGYTEKALDGKRFRIDDWFTADLGVPDHVRWFKIAETVQLLKPDAAKLEIIIP